MLDPYPLSVWLHLLAAVVWIGGITFLVLVALPVLRGMPDDGRRSALVRDLGRRFRVVGWICLGTLLLTGLFQLHRVGFTAADLAAGRAFAGRFGRILAAKLTLVALILVGSVVHDFWVGPRAGRLARARPDSAAARRWRRAASWLGRLNLLLALAVSFLGVALLHARW